MSAQPIPLTPDWQQITVALHRRYGSDDKLVTALSWHGVLIDRTSITRLRRGVYTEPKHFEVCAALLNLHAVPSVPPTEHEGRSWPAANRTENER